MSRQHKNGSTKRNKRRQKTPRTRELIFADDGQLYGRVTKMLGNGRCSLYLSNGLKTLGVIRGKMKFRTWVRLDDLVLVSERDYQDGKVDILHVYSQEHARIIMDQEGCFNEPDTKEEEITVEFEFEDI